MNETIQAFIDSINAHDLESLAKLTTDDHVFIDSYGNEMQGRETMTAGWRGYFELFPDTTLRFLRCSKTASRSRSSVSPADHSKETTMPSGVYP